MAFKYHISILVVKFILALRRLCFHELRTTPILYLSVDK